MRQPGAARRAGTKARPRLRSSRISTDALHCKPSFGARAAAARPMLSRQRICVTSLGICAMPISKTAGGHSNQYRARRPLSSASSMHSDAHCSPLRCSSTLQSVTLRAPAVNSLGTRYQLAAHKLNQSPHTLAKTPKAPAPPLRCQIREPA